MNDFSQNHENTFCESLLSLNNIYSLRKNVNARLYSVYLNLVILKTKKTIFAEDCLSGSKSILCSINQSSDHPEIKCITIGNDKESNNPYNSVTERKSKKKNQRKNIYGVETNLFKSTESIMATEVQDLMQIIVQLANEQNNINMFV
ncbi:hypothetical protein HZS_4055 [Henneguya salminicola]|nr:hypothetical protein HZS_4055 [Henneguya salminicola]